MVDTGNQAADIAGRDKELSLASCVIIAFDLHLFNALESVEKKWLPLTATQAKENTPVILVGTKLDIRDPQYPYFSFCFLLLLFSFSFLSFIF